MALYRLPFPAEANAMTWKARGNWDQAGHGVGQTNNPTDEQAYAFDLNLPRAARSLPPERVR
jgi:hypothetical protein